MHDQQLIKEILLILESDKSLFRQFNRGIMIRYIVIIAIYFLSILKASVTVGQVSNSNAGELIVLSSRHQLFLDDYLIASMSNITRKVNPVQKHPANPVVRPDKSWEKPIALIFGSVIYDAEDRIYKMWYFTGGGHVGYATSNDGVQWEKPALDVITYEGQRTNLVIQRGNFGYYYELFDVIKDSHDPNPARRYKMTFVSIKFDEKEKEHWWKFSPGQRRGVGTAVSPDGIHWTLLNNWANEDIGDISHSFWNPCTQKYTLYGRTKYMGQELIDAWGKIPWFEKNYWGRAVALTESKDFETWTPASLVFKVDIQDELGSEIYSMAVFPYEGIYIGLVQMFYCNPGSTRLDIQLAVSRDGQNFIRAGNRETFIPLGGIGAWDRYNNAVCNLPVVRGDELWFYYSGRTYRHGPYAGPDNGTNSGYIGIGSIKKDRFVSLEASFDEGTVLTKPLKIQGSQLFVNANAEFGSLQIDILDLSGKIIPGYSAAIENQAPSLLPVIFGQKSVRDLAETDVLLRFTLRNAQLYAVWAE